MITISKNLEQSLLKIAQQEHEPIDHLIERALTKFLEDYQDIQDAEQVLKRINLKKTQLVDWKTVKSELYNDEDVLDD